jgi:hypothetical protein
MPKPAKIRREITVEQEGNLHGFVFPQQVNRKFFASSVSAGLPEWEKLVRTTAKNLLITLKH